MAWLERRKGPTGFRFRVAWRVGDDMRKGPWIDRKTDAEQALRSTEAIQAAAEPLKRGAKVETWETLVEKYCTYKRVAKKRSAAHLEKVHGTMLRLGKEHGWRDAESVTAEDCGKLCPYHGRVVRAVLNYARNILEQRINVKALSERQEKQTSKPKVLLEPALVAQLVSAAGVWSAGDGALAHMISTYGHRAESLVNLKVSALAGDHLTLRVKSQDTHRHPLLPATLKILRALAAGRGKDEPLFVGHLGVPWESGKAFSAWWGHSVAKGHPGAGILGLRRFAITGMLALGLDAKTTASITGHRTVDLLLNTYAQTSEARQQDAMAAMQKVKRVAGGAPATQMLPKRRHKSFKGP